MHHAKLLMGMAVWFRIIDTEDMLASAKLADPALFNEAYLLIGHRIIIHLFGGYMGYSLK